MKLTTYKKSGEKLSSVTVSDSVFGQKENNVLLSEVVREHLSNRRSAIANTKDRSEVSGGGKKPWKQKGTGRARAGSSRSPIWRGGGVTFGPTSAKNYTLKINKKAKVAARNISLSQKAKDNSIYTIKDFASINRDELLKLLDKLKLEGKKILLVTGKDELDVFKKTRNVVSIDNLSAESLNTFDILNNDVIIWSEKTLTSIGKN